ncbi:MAG: hypothetical protein Q4B06_03655 [Candidatus Saccharibacteria bacterium]|nr:hypothetical protein [Candidatus Saccharibacteria bacterium]
MLSRILVVVGVVSAVALLYIINNTTPSHAGAMGVLAVFLLLYVVSAVLLTFFVYWTNRLVMRVFFMGVATQKADRLSLRRSYYYGSVLALGPVMLISLQSVGNGGVTSLLLVVVLLALGVLYVARQTA